MNKRGRGTSIKNKSAVALGKKRWTATGDDPREIGALGGLASRGKSGRPKSSDRCPCGAMTRTRAGKRNHRCKVAV